MTEIDEFSSLSSFFVFNEEMPGESEKVKCYYYYPECTTREQINKQDVEVGISSTFIFFTKNFKPDTPCDYIFTGKREIGLLHIGGGIYFNVSIKSSTSTKRFLLNRILNNILLILNCVAGPISFEKDTNKVSQEWITRLQMFMPSIIKVINWRDPVFEMLFDSYFPSDSHLSLSKFDSDKQINNVLQEFPCVSSIIFTWRDKIINFQGIDSRTARILTLLVFHKFEPFFPYKIKKREDVLRWTIGFTKKQDQLEVFTPPVFVNGSVHPIAVLQLNKIRIILLLDAKKITDINILQSITRHLNPIAHAFDTIETKVNSQTKIKIRLNFISFTNMLKISNNNVQIYDFETIERGILLAHGFSVRLGKNSTGTFPLGNNFHSFFHCDPEQMDSFVVMQFKPKSISDGINVFSDIIKK